MLLSMKYFYHGILIYPQLKQEEIGTWTDDLKINMEFQSFVIFFFLFNRRQDPLLQVSWEEGQSFCKPNPKELFRITLVPVTAVIPYQCCLSQGTF